MQCKWYMVDGMLVWCAGEVGVPGVRAGESAEEVASRLGRVVFDP